MKKFYYLNGEKVKVIKDLNIKDHDGTWVQVEHRTGVKKGYKQPTTLERLSNDKTTN